MNTTAGLSYSLKLRIMLSSEQNHRCAICGIDTYIHNPSHRHQRMATIEHIIPASEGGKLHKHNCLMTCIECNAARQTMDMMKFYKRVSSPKYLNSYAKGASKQTAPKPTPSLKQIDMKNAIRLHLALTMVWMFPLDDINHIISRLTTTSLKKERRQRKTVPMSLRLQRIARRCSGMDDVPDSVVIGNGVYTIPSYTRTDPIPRYQYKITSALRTIEG